MKKLFVVSRVELFALLPLLFLLLPLSASASEQILMGADSALQSATNHYIVPAFRASAGTLSTTTSIISPVAGTFSTLYGYTRNGAGAETNSSDFTFKLEVNGVDTALTCGVGAGVSCSDLADTVAIKAGDSWIMHITRTTGSAYGYFSLKFIPTNNNDTVLFTSQTGSNAFSGTAEQYVSSSFFQAPNSTITTTWIPFADAGTVDDFYVAATSTTATGSYDFTVLGTPSITSTTVGTSTITCQINTTNALCSDLTHSTTTSLGSLMSWAGMPNAPSTRGASLSARFVPTTAGNYELMSNCRAATGSDPQFCNVSGATTNGSNNAFTVEASSTLYAQPMVITAIAVRTGNAPGSGKTRALTLRVNGINTAVTCTSTQAAPSCTASGFSVEVNQGDKIDIGTTDSGTSGSQNVQIALSAHPQVSTRPSFPTTSSKHRVWSGFVKFLGGFFRLK